MLYCVLVFGILMIITSIWFGACNQKTLKQRSEIIDYAYTQVDWQEKSKTFQSISYDKHLWFLFTFRDANKLYSKIYEVKQCSQ